VDECNADMNNINRSVNKSNDSVNHGTSLNIDFCVIAELSLYCCILLRKTRCNELGVALSA
jgi:hypothetical protein